MKIVKKGFRLFCSLLLILIAIYNCLILTQKWIGKEKIPEIFGYRNLIVLTGSMAPTFQKGDVVIVKETDEIQKNDIISFEQNHTIVTHRVIEIKEEKGTISFVTKGDANSGIDEEEVKKEEVLGKYVTAIPKLGTILLFLKRPIVLLILFFVIGLGYAVSGEKESKKKEKGERYEQKN